MASCEDTSQEVLEKGTTCVSYCEGVLRSGYYCLCSKTPVFMGYREKDERWFDHRGLRDTRLRKRKIKKSERDSRRGGKGFSVFCIFLICNIWGKRDNHSCPVYIIMLIYYNWLPLYHFFESRLCSALEDASLACCFCSLFPSFVFLAQWKKKEFAFFLPSAVAVC